MLTVSFPYWLIPTIITIVGFVYAIYIYDNDSNDYFAGMGNIFLLVPVSIISMISWIIYAVFK